MKTALAIPCFIREFYPDVIKSTENLLKTLGIEYEIPENQTCCGQPLANSGYEHKAIGIYKKNVKLFKDFDNILMLAGSCTYHIREHYDTIEQDKYTQSLRNNIHDIVQYVHEYHFNNLPQIEFPYKIAFHTGCHSLRGMRFGISSELQMNGKYFLNAFAEKFNGAELIKIEKPDECCGFGGTFSVFFDEISVKMGNDKLQALLSNNVEYLISNDMSCMLHLQGIIDRNSYPLKLLHVFQVFNQSK